MLKTVTWIRTYASNLDRVLRHQLLEMYRPYKWLPCFLHKFLYLFRAYFVKHDVIVQFSEGLNETQIPRVRKKKHDLPIINGIGARLTAKSMTELLDAKYVSKIWLDSKVTAILDVAAPSIKADKIWPPSTSVSTSSYTGKGIGIAIVDTGVYPHPDLTQPKNRIVAFKDFVNNKSTPYDDNGHGTHCAGDAAGNGISPQLENARSSKKKKKNTYTPPEPPEYKGIAYEASIIGVKVLNKLGSGNLSTVIAGIQWCIDNKDKYNIRIISLSLGAPVQTCPYVDDVPNDPMCKAVSVAWSEGIVVCAAAGNEGPDKGTIANPGINRDIITVGAASDNNTVTISDDTIADFSSRGPTICNDTKPDIVTPGVGIISLRSPNSFLDKFSPDKRVGDWYFSLSGTSMATPICAGAVALMLEANPDLTPLKVKTLLMEGVEDLGDSPNAQGAGYINMEKIFTKLK